VRSSGPIARVAFEFAQVDSTNLTKPFQYLLHEKDAVYLVPLNRRLSQGEKSPRPSRVKYMSGTNRSFNASVVHGEASETRSPVKFSRKHASIVDPDQCLCAHFRLQIKNVFFKSVGRTLLRT